ncbi:MAG: helix-turn-helix transcriptional regulator [Bacteroidota bacterium]
MASDPSAPLPPASGPRIEHDLQAIREANDLSLDALQRETRMPSDILRRFEAGELVGDPNYNEVYLRNLLKSYAQALGVAPKEVSDAFDAMKAGTYDGSLRRLYVDGESEAPLPQTPPPPTSPDTAPAVAALSEPPAKKEVAPPVTERTAEHMPKRRVQTAKAAASTASPIEKSWGVIIGSTVAAVVVIAAVLWFLLRDPSPEPEIAEARPAPADTAQAAAPAEADTAAVAEPAAPANAPAFQTPIQLTVTATDEPLENFRVQVDDDARRPHWVEPGQSTSFTAQQRIAVWGETEAGTTGGGEYDGAVLALQGLEWTPSDGQVVRISAEGGQAVLDSLARTAR